jgi:hypothetical protein
MIQLGGLLLFCLSLIVAGILTGPIVSRDMSAPRFFGSAALVALGIFGILIVVSEAIL